MLQKASRTKVVWSLSPNSFRKFGATKLAERLTAGPQSAIRATFAGNMAEHLKELRQALNQPLEKNRSLPTPEGWFPFLLSLCGRRAILQVPGNKRTLANDETVEIHFRVDLQAATLCSPVADSLNRFEVVVTAADVYHNLKAESQISFSYGQIVLVCTAVKDVNANERVVTARVISGGNALTGMDVDSSDFASNLFPLIPEDEKTLSKKFEGLADYVVVEGIRNDEELLKIKNAIVPSNNGGKQSHRHPTVAISANVKSAEGEVSPRLLLKVDTKDLLEMLPKLLVHVDGVLLSRSELGMSVHPHSLPIVQKEVIASCNQAGKTVVVASELMYSMRTNATPTRAEVSDLANAVADGADAVILSEEVTEGPFSFEVAEVTGDTLKNSEPFLEVNWHRVPFEIKNDDDAIAYGTLKIAEHSGAKAVVCLTEGGYTALRLASLRAPIPIVALCYNKSVMRQLNLIRAVYAAQIEPGVAFDEILSVTKDMLVQYFGLSRGDQIIFVSLTASSVAARNSNLFTLQEI